MAESITSIEKKSTLKSRQRVTDHGEVFTGDREVNAMLDLVKQETERIDSRFLEPACGDGNFLAEILRRKLIVAKRESKIPRRKIISSYDFEKKSFNAVCSLYGVDILLDNVIACRQRLYDIWNAEYTTVCGQDADDICRQSLKVILEKNIICGNALSLKCVDERGIDTDKPIVFSEWTFINNSDYLLRKDYRFDRLMLGHTIAHGLPNIGSENKLNQFDLLDAIEPVSDEGELIQEQIYHYKRVV